MIENLFTFVRTLGNQRIEGKKFFVTQVGLLGTLSDNSGSIGTAGKVLSSTGNGVSWITVGSSNVQSLNDLTDVVISTAATGNLLRYDGTSWVNWAPNFLTSYGSLNDLSDVDAANPDNGQILRYNDTTNTWYADDESVLGIPTLQEVTDEGSTTTNSITAGGFSTSGSVTAAVVTTPLIEREGVLTINSEQQVDQGEPNPNLLYVSWLGDNKFVVNADGYAIANAGFKVVGGTSSGFLKANGTIDTSTYLTSYTETQTLDAVTDLGNTTTNSITVGGVTAPELNYGGLLTINADSAGSLQPQQGDPTVPVLSFEWAGTQQGYIDTDGKITFNGFKTPTGTSSGFLKANGTVDTNAYITEVEYIDDIGDVTISSAAVGDVLMFDGSEWVNATIDNADYVSKVQHEVKAGVAITKGQAVYVTSADGTNMIVGLASNASEATSSKTMGIALSNAAINGKFFVITEGLIDGLNTSAATAGQPVWLGTGGNLIFGLTNKPVAPAHLVYIGVVTRANANNGEIFVHIQNGFELNEIHDALITSPIVGQLLRRDTDGLWKNWTPNYITASSSDVLTNKRINLSTGLTSATPVDSIDAFIGQNDILLYQDGIDKGGTIDVDSEGNISISNPGIGYYSGDATTEGGSRFSVTVAGNTLTGTIAEFNAALTDGDFATQAYVSTQIANLVDGAPTTLDTLNELAAALGDDANFATTVATSIGTKQNQLNGTGFVKANGTTITYDNSSYITTESDPVFVSSVAYGITSENITNWDAAFDWGNHADAGYLTSLPDHNHTISDVTGLQTALDGKVPTTRTITINGTALDLSADRSWTISSADGYISDVRFADTTIEFTGEGSAFNGSIDLSTLPFAASSHTHVIADVTGLQTALDNKAPLSHNHDDRYYTETESDAKFYLATNPSDYQTTIGTVANVASGAISNLSAAWTAPGTSISNGFRVYRYDSDAANKPVTQDNANWLINIYSHPTGGTASYGHQLAAANSNNIYFRSVSNGSFSDWHKFWSTNDFSSTTISNWNTAYGWGNHALAGYQAASTAITTSNIGLQSVLYAASSGSSNLLRSLGSYVWSAATNGRDFAEGLQVSFVREADGYQSYGSVVRVHTYPNDGASAELYFPYSEEYGGNSMQYRLGLYNNAEWSSWKTLVDSENIGLYALTSLPSHTHTIANITGLQTALDGKAASSHTHSASDITSGTISTDRLPKQELGISIVGNFGQWQAHSTYQNLNTDVAYWGWNFVQGSTNAPHQSSSQWYRGRFSLGDEYGLGTSTGDYWMEIAIPRYNQDSTAGNLFVRTCENGSINAWQGVRAAFATDSDLLDGQHGSYYQAAATAINTSNIGSQSVSYADESGYSASAGSVEWSNVQSKPATFPPSTHNHDSDYVNVGGDTMTGNLTLKYSTTDSSDYEGLRFSPYSDEAGLNDYIIKAASDKGVFGRKSFGWHVHTESAFGVYSNGWVQLFGVEGGTGNTQVFGNLTVSGSITESSSIRYKKDVVDIESASAKVEQLKPVRYKKIKDDQEEIGLIAEDVAELFPEVVKYDNEGRPDGVNYSRLSVILLKAVQELTERVNKLENK